MSKSFVWGLIAGLTFLIVAGVGASKLQDKDKKQYQAEFTDATPIQLGVMTEKQEQHSKLYSRYNTRNKIPDLLKLEDNGIDIRRHLPTPVDYPGQVRSEADDIKRITCDADTIVLGTVKRSASQITEGQSFLFTDYVLLVQQVLKNNSRSLIQQEAEIIITRPGGAVLIGNKRVTAIDESIPLLQQGKQYLLFLRYLPETDSFESIETGESYEVNRNDLQLLRYQPEGVISAKHNSISFVNEVKTAVGGPCN
jgi:hypothetical protein